MLPALIEPGKSYAWGCVDAHGAIAMDKDWPAYLLKSPPCRMARVLVAAFSVPLALAFVGFGLTAL